MRRVDAALSLALLLGACASAPPLPRPSPRPPRSTTQQQAVYALGERLFDGLREGSVGAVLVDEATLGRLFVPAAQQRLHLERVGSRAHVAGAPWASVWRDHAYVGVCAQSVDVDGRSLGVDGPGWLLDRVLVVAERGGMRSAAWVTGLFLLTTDGFRTIAISEVEAPRPGHADLELAPCDVQRGL